MAARFWLRACSGVLGTAAVVVAVACSAAAEDESASATTQGAVTPGGEPAQFVSMWGHERGDESHDALLEGTLVIEAPCVYVVGSIGYEQSGEPRFDRSLLQLPRSGTRYDAETREVWVWDEGPLVTGDQVGAGGGEGWPDGDASECSFDSVWAATDLTPIPQPSFEQLLDSSDKVDLRWTVETWRRLIADETAWEATPQSVAEIASSSTLIVIGRVDFIDFDPIYAPRWEGRAQGVPRPAALSYANVGVLVDRVVAGEFRHHRAASIKVSIWQDDIPTGETFLPTGHSRPVLLFLQAKDAYFAHRGIDPLTLLDGLDANTAAKVAAEWGLGYYLTSVEGVLVSTPDGFRNPLLSHQPDADADEPLSPVQQDSNTMSLRELEQTIRDVLPAYVAGDAIAETVSHVPSPPFEAMLYEYEYGPLSIDASVRVGALALEPPCAYLLVAPPSGADAATPPERHLLHLPRLGAQYDTETGELWVFGNGPFVTGDRVGAIGGEFADGRDAPSCSYDSTWGAVHIRQAEVLP